MDLNIKIYSACFKNVGALYQKVFIALRKICKTFPAFTHGRNNNGIALFMNFNLINARELEFFRQSNCLICTFFK